MKWFFATNQQSLENPIDDWTSLIKVAVLSAQANTTLEPHFLYDGENNELTQWLEDRSIPIIRHRTSLYDFLAKHCENNYPGDVGHLQVATGAFLRVDIPIIELESKFILYTDCDVLFLGDPNIDDLSPEFFACAPQMHRGQYQDMNSGVMLMNCPRLRNDHLLFTYFIEEKFGSLHGYDQECFRRFYSGRYDQLSDVLNWKPYWGINEEAKIVHFHGPKPFIVERLINEPSYETYEVYHNLFQKNIVSYQNYLRIWKFFAAQS